MTNIQENKTLHMFGTKYPNNINLDFLPEKVKKRKLLGKHICFASSNIQEWCEKRV